MQKRQKIFASACLAALSTLVRADQPVHCKSSISDRHRWPLNIHLSNDKIIILATGVKSQVAGYWTFHVSNEAVKPDIYTAEQVCTHELPNK